jgi:predicted RNA-binding protein with PIN domain
MAYLIDGNNLIGHLKEGAGVGEPGSRAEITAKLLVFQQVRRTKIILVFDGRPPDEGSGIEVNPKFSILSPEPGESADDVIQQRILRQADKRRFFVVSSDREIRDFARAHGVRDLSAAEFGRELRKALREQRNRKEMRKASESPSPLEVRLWGEVFQMKK